jgi:hypothetical protein
MALLVDNLQPFTVVFQPELLSRFGAGALTVVGQVVGGKKVTHVINMLFELVIEGNVKAVPGHKIRSATQQYARN